MEFSREQALLRKSKTPRKLLEKWTLLSLAFYNAPSLHTVEKTLLPIETSVLLVRGLRLESSRREWSLWSVLV